MIVKQTVDRRCLPLVIVLLSLFGFQIARGQSKDEKKFEVGAHFTTVGIADARSLAGRTEAGFGGRLGYNLSLSLALEAEVNFFPRDYSFVTTDFTGGRVTQGLFGLKAGMRKKRFGFFGKVRPGFVSSGGAARASFPNGNGPDPNNRFGFERFRATQLNVDLGGVVELYPTPQTLIRFDIGDTITRFPNVEFFCFPTGVPCPEDVYKHKAQISAGFGFRF